MGSKNTFLGDFHLHSNFSDGKLTIPQIVDLYGSHGFGVICLTDHIAEKETWLGKAAVLLKQVLTEDRFALYLETIRTEAERAWDQYQMIVLPGYELSKNNINNHRSAHVLGIGVSEFMYADGDPVDLAKALKAQGALSMAAHPVKTRKMEKQTYHLWDRREELSNTFDAWELASGQIIFDEVKATRLPKIASSDFHSLKHFASWKTKFTCELHPQAILDAIRTQAIDFAYFDGSRIL
jgi:predicted metal-dependent phosphoesterase TrpH